jgi:hypothetical protein
LAINLFHTTHYMGTPEFPFGVTALLQAHIFAFISFWCQFSAVTQVIIVPSIFKPLCTDLPPFLSPTSTIMHRHSSIHWWCPAVWHHGMVLFLCFSNHLQFFLSLFLLYVFWACNTHFIHCINLLWMFLLLSDYNYPFGSHLSHYHYAHFPYTLLFYLLVAEVIFHNWLYST